jgi:hypothetical protein
MGASARPSESHPDANAAHASSGAAPPAIDVEKLADKVYRLMVADVRLELARRGGSTDRR